jgi:hypothetical protein
VGGSLGTFGWQTGYWFLMAVSGTVALVDGIFLVETLPEHKHMYALGSCAGIT